MGRGKLVAEKEWLIAVLSHFAHQLFFERELFRSPTHPSHPPFDRDPSARLRRWQVRNIGRKNKIKIKAAGAHTVG